jgi:DNA primase
MRRSIELLLARNLRIRILKLPGGLDPDDFVRQQGGGTYKRLLAGAPYFWQYLMSEASTRYDLEDPALKAAAVRDVLEPVAKIQDRVEQLEIARCLAEGFKVPESLVLERLNLSGRRSQSPPVARTTKLPPSRKLMDAEKQLIQVLVQNPSAGQALSPLRENEFWQDVWSWPVVSRLIEGAADIDSALDGVEDEQLRREVRGAVMEMSTSLTIEYAFSSVYKLYDGFLDRQEKAVRQQLQACGSGAAPAELLRKHQEIVFERKRIRGGVVPNP